MSMYKRYFDKTKCIYFVIKVEKMFNKYMKIWEKVSNITKNKFHSELVYNKKYLKAKNEFNTKERKISMFSYTSNIDLVSL